MTAVGPEVGRLRTRVVLRCLALGSFAALLGVTAPAWPDDWDGIGFVESIGDFDLARFRPHPPGYPVYVALLRVAAAAAGPPMRACALVAVAAGVATIALTWDAVRAVAGERDAWAVAAVLGVTPMVWRACSGVGSEGPALACVAACAWGLAASLPSYAGAPASGRRSPGSLAQRSPIRWLAGPLALGAGAGLGCGVRLSWAPLYLAAMALSPRGQRGRVWTWAAASCAAWAVPWVAVIGPRELGFLCAAQLRGHVVQWGGSAWTEPGPVRLGWLARDVFVDGFGVGGDALGGVIAALVCAATAAAFAAWRRSRWRGTGAAIAAFAPYTLWVLMGQNVRDQPRHVLPIVALAAAAMAHSGLGAAARAAGSAGRVGSARTASLVSWHRGRGIVASLALALAARTSGDALARRATPPAGQQLVDLARRQSSPERLLVMGGQSVRFFEASDLAAHARVVGSVGDAEMALTRVAVLPSRVWLTGELADLDRSRWPLEHVATLCRPARVDRRLPCLDVYAWKVPFLPAP